ncbi:MAG TPA: non-canonical purine NTP pyrophosphatase [Candidatus Saccharimonadales bacterium]|jgi:non-canonical purine NTP pyrophosphatase (RdgB/HAM1 family)|nr:non-canonical purine NTP pyrophosphatase [Candidatus Saccharimonadales bacterium]
MNVTFITGNQNKADYLAKYLGVEVAHQKVDVEEIQSTDLKEITTLKAKQAYEIVKGPVLVEDVGLTFHALGKLPGPFIKWFDMELGHEKLCRLLDQFDDRSATAGCVFAYYDGKDMHLFEADMKGHIADHPKGDSGYGWDPIFVPEGFDKTRAEFTPEEYAKSYTASKPFGPFRDFLLAKSGD